MTHRNKYREQSLSQSPQPYVDVPRYGSGDRKSMQLCAQVRRALEYGIDEILQGEVMVAVADVVPAPNTAHLLVLVQPLEDLPFEETIRIQKRLIDATAKLRVIVSQAINRRKTPGLSFQVLPTQKSP
jgi:ribosome-binding factor A